ncbi:MAG: serine hydrolase [Saprospiraceae bacterium]
MSKGQSTYFPPISSDNWETVSPEAMGWCPQNVNDLYNFLDDKGTKAFIVLKDGKIVIEKYYGTFTKDSTWYWASAGKSLAGFLTGMAQEKGLLNIQDKTSKYLGNGWAGMSQEKEDKITIWHQLSMTTGLDDNVLDDNCMLPSCLTYKADAGTRWAYHNAPYRLVHEVIAKAWGNTYQNFMNTQLSIKTGITGLWINGTMYSRPRNMARFGLLMMNEGDWDGQKILGDRTYIAAMVTPSQSLNRSYGLLWWLNSQPSFMLPDLQFVFNTHLIPNAPKEAWCALGKNDQKIYVLPSQRVVIIRMGNDGGEVTGAVSSFDNLLWEKINRLSCTSSLEGDDLDLAIFPNPAMDQLYIKNQGMADTYQYKLYSTDGLLLKEGQTNPIIDISSLNQGVYLIKVGKPGKSKHIVKKFIKL